MAGAGFGVSVGRATSRTIRRWVAVVKAKTTRCSGCVAKATARCGGLRVFRARPRSRAVRPHRGAAFPRVDLGMSTAVWVVLNRVSTHRTPNGCSVWCAGPCRRLPGQRLNAETADAGECPWSAVRLFSCGAASSVVGAAIGSRSRAKEVHRQDHRECHDQHCHRVHLCSSSSSVSDVRSFEAAVSAVIAAGRKSDWGLAGHTCLAPTACRSPPTPPNVTSPEHKADIPGPGLALDALWRCPRCDLSVGCADMTAKSDVRRLGDLGLGA